MNKLLLVVGLVVLVSGSVFGEGEFDKIYEKQQQEGGYFLGDPNQNEILEVMEDYIVIRNPTAKAKIYIPILESYLVGEVFYLEALAHCSKHKTYRNVFATPSNATALDNHTVYLFCNEGISDLYFRNKNNYSQEDETKVSLYKSCLDYYKKDEMFELLRCEKRIKNVRKKWPDIDTYVSMLNAHQKKYNDRSFIFELKKKVLAKANTQQTIDAQQKKMETCSAYGFEVGSDPFGQCIFKLMELELEYAKLENERMRLEGQRQQAELNNQNDLAQSLALQSMAAAQDKSLRIQQFGMFMQGLQQLTQPTPSQLNPKITCNQFGGQFRCW